MSTNTVYLTVDNFDEEVLKSTVPVVVDFYADWCGPCKALAPIMDDLADKYEGKAKICKLNIDDHRKLALNYKVMSIPTMFFFKDGEVKERIVGGLPQPVIEQKIDAML
ncbi:MAG: thioredoxin [Firmicutes bacterium HGW-Firmicutes-11]|jgi:thioredoxin 1|nr:MAG: thioredoxin [Firmicutes bacterium HGW-Firmicutes-11]